METAPSGSAINRFFEISLFLLVTVGFLALASTGKLDIPSMLAVSAALMGRALRYRRHRQPELTSRTVTLLTCLYFAWYGIDYLFLSRNFLGATTHLVLFLAVVKIYSARSNRDYLWLTLIAFLEILAAATLTVDTTFLIFFFLFLLVGISTFISFEIKHSAERARPSVLLAAGTPLARRLERSLLITSLAVALATLALGAVIFLILPRVGTSYFSSFAFSVEQISGFSSQVTLGEVGTILKNRAVVMRIHAEAEDSRSLDGLRWRGMALARFDGHRWYALPSNPVILSASLDGRFLLPLKPLARNQRRRQQYRVLLEPLSTDVLFAAAVPVEVRSRFRVLGVDGSNGLLNLTRAFTLTSYTVVSETGVPSPEQLRSAPPVYPEGIREAYLQLPPSDPRVAQLAHQVTAPARSAYDRAAALEHFLRTAYGYTLELPAEPEADPISSFLFERRRGHCEYFATAMTIMLRTLGIPARLVNGFQTGEYNEVSENYIVRASDAHTWVEVFFPELGWVAFDPTPSDPNEVGTATWWTTVQHYFDAFALWWDEWVINYDALRQWRLASEVRDLSRDLLWGRLTWQQRLRQWRRELTTTINEAGARALASPSLRWAGIILAGLVLLAWRGRHLRDWLRLRALLRGGESQALDVSEATLVYRQVLKWLARFGYYKSQTQTPLEFVSRIPPADLASRVWEFTELYNRIRFGAPGAREAASMRLLELLRQIQGSKPYGQAAARPRG